MTSRLPNPFDPSREPDEDSTLGEDDPAEALIGRTIAGRYRVTSILGRGGMGVVYGGVHLELERDVAIKVLPGQFTRDNDVLKRFEREARTASKVAHKNVVTVYDYGRLESGEPYLVMERLTGRDLDAVLGERRRLPPVEALAVLAPLADALDAMHAQSVVHRDIKPSNVFFAADGAVKLVDFGLAVFRSAAAGDRLTRTGSVVGTAEYMAPEAARGALVDARGDVYSLAALAYEILSGSIPFSGQPVQVLIDKVSHRAPKISTISDLRFSDAIDRVFERALDRRPEARHGSASEFVRALREAIETSAPATIVPAVVAPMRAPNARPPEPVTDTAPTVPGERRRTWILAVLALLLASLLGVTVFFAFGIGDGAGEPSAGLAEPIVPPVALPREPDRALVDPVPAAIPEASDAPTGAFVAPIPEAAPDARRARARAPSATAAAATTAPATAAGGAPERVAPTPADDPERIAGSERERRPITGDALDPDEGGAERAAELVREAQSALLRGEIPRARSLYREATNAAPRHAPAWRGLGLSSERLGMSPEAIQAYERYLRIAPGAGDADAVRERIARLGGA